MTENAQRVDRIIIIVLVLLLMLLLILFLFPQNNIKTASENKPKEKLSVSDYNGKKIGIATGTNLEAESFRQFPDSEYFYFDGYPNLNTALLNYTIDAFLVDEPAMKSIHAANPDIDYIKERLTHNSYSFAFRKNDEQERILRNDFNDFMAEINENGIHDEIEEIWFGFDESRKVVDMSDLTGENGTIHVVTTSTDEPFSYIKDGQHVGYDIDVIVRYCRARGYALEIGDVAFQARIPALDSGRYEFTTTMNVTPEREESVLFSVPVSEGGIVVAVRSEDLGLMTAETAEPASPGERVSVFFENLRLSFEKNFIREQRWKLIFSGLGTTCFITFMSILIGAILSFLVCMFRLTGSRLANAISDIYVRLMQGIPTVILLMILYYVVLKNTGLQAVWIAIAGFTLNNVAYVSEMLYSGINSVNKGQREAALALGFSENQSFYRFVFPQALVRVLPVIRGEAINLLKSTSVAGYIAIQDLTKMSDIIRSRTFEAFFPLTVTALIYFLLSWIIAVIADALLNKLDRRRSGRRDRNTTGGEGNVQ